MPSTALITLEVGDRTVTTNPMRLDIAIRIMTPPAPASHTMWEDRFWTLLGVIEERLALAGINASGVRHLSELLILIGCKEFDFCPWPSVIFPPDPT